MTDSPEMLAAIKYDEEHPPADGEMSAAEAVAYCELESAECRCMDSAEGGLDDALCGWHNPRFHSMEGVEEYYHLLNRHTPPTQVGRRVSKTRLQE